MSKLRYKREFTDNLSQEEFDEEVSEMAILTTKNTGMPYKILIDSIGIERKRKNNSPRIMISIDEHYRDIVPVSIDQKNPEVLIDRKNISDIELIFNWIKSNYEILIKHWNQEIDDFDALDLLSEE